MIIVILIVITVMIAILIIKWKTDHNNIPLGGDRVAELIKFRAILGKNLLNEAAKGCDRGGIVGSGCQTVGGGNGKERRFAGSAGRNTIAGCRDKNKLANSGAGCGGAEPGGWSS